jgi:hypothetical protein
MRYRKRMRKLKRMEGTEIITADNNEEQRQKLRQHDDHRKRSNQQYNEEEAALNRPRETEESKVEM